MKIIIFYLKQIIKIMILFGGLPYLVLVDNGADIRITN